MGKNSYYMFITCCAEVVVCRRFCGCRAACQDSDIKTRKPECVWYLPHICECLGVNVFTFERKEKARYLRFSVFLQK